MACKAVALDVFRMGCDRRTLSPRRVGHLRAHFMSFVCDGATFKCFSSDVRQARQDRVFLRPVIESVEFVDIVDMGEGLGLIVAPRVMVRIYNVSPAFIACQTP